LVLQRVLAWATESPSAVFVSTEFASTLKLN
jgi:hypothetical protein